MTSPAMPYRRRPLQVEAVQLMRQVWWYVRRPWQIRLVWNVQHWFRFYGPRVRRWLAQPIDIGKLGVALMMVGGALFFLAPLIFPTR